MTANDVKKWLKRVALEGQAMIDQLEAQADAKIDAGKEWPAEHICLQVLEILVDCDIESALERLDEKPMYDGTFT